MTMVKAAMVSRTKNGQRNATDGNKSDRMQAQTLMQHEKDSSQHVPKIHRKIPSLPYGKRDWHGVVVQWCVPSQCIVVTS
jgi:hypothetical protein